MEVILPEDMIIEIGTYLPVEDIFNCNLVNRHWRNSLNNNKIWSRICSEKFKVDKTSCPLITWPCGVQPAFSPPPNFSERLLPPCSWWIRYMQETRIENNIFHGRFKEHSLPSNFFLLKILSGSLVGFENDKLGFEFHSLFPFRTIDFIKTDVPFQDIPYHYVNDQELLFIREPKDEPIGYYYKKEGLKYELKTTINLSEDLKRISKSTLSRKIYHCENGFLVFFCNIYDIHNCIYTSINIWNLKDFTKKTAQFLPEPIITGMKIFESKLFFYYYSVGYFHLNFLEFDTMKIKSMQIVCDEYPSLQLILNDEIILGNENIRSSDVLICNIYNGKTFSILFKEQILELTAVNSKYIVFQVGKYFKLFNCDKKIFERQIVMKSSKFYQYFLKSSRVKTAGLTDVSNVRDNNNLKSRCFMKKLILDQRNLVKGPSNTVVCSNKSLFQFW